MPVAQTVGDFAWVAVFGIGVGLLVIIVGFILWNIWGKKKERKDMHEEMKKEMMHDSKINVPEHMRMLYRLPIPFMSEFVEGIKDDKTRDETIQKLSELFATNYRAVPLGEITGFNRIDLIVTIEDLVMPDGKFDDPLNKDKKSEKRELSEKDINDLIELVKQAGRFVNLIVYKPRKKGMLDFPKEEVVMAFQDMLVGIDSEDGNVCLLGQGLDRIGHFQIPSGYPERMRVWLTYLVERGYIRYVMRTQSSMIDLLEDAIRFDSGFQKGLGITALQNPPMNRRPEQGGMPK
jgi:hypothetical protein